MPLGREKEGTRQGGRVTDIDKKREPNSLKWWDVITLGFESHDSFQITHTKQHSNCLPSSTNLRYPCTPLLPLSIQSTNAFSTILLPGLTSFHCATSTPLYLLFAHSFASFPLFQCLWDAWHCHLQEPLLWAQANAANEKQWQATTTIFSRVQTADTTSHAQMLSISRWASMAQLWAQKSCTET